MNEKQFKALDYIESLIQSMRKCSFRCKEFAILICSAFLTIFATINPTPKIMIILCVPILMIFWIMDSFYLAKERVFRKEYKRIATLKNVLDVNPLLFSTKSINPIKDYIKALFCSFSTSLFYLTLIVISLIFGVLILNEIIIVKNQIC